MAVALTLLVAWQASREEYLVPDSGAGYWIGVAGALVILSVLFYPWRKKNARSTRWGKIAKWFKFHMVMGVLGPALIIIHSNFTLKSINATVAMATMLFVVASGIIGRFLYAKTHQDLYGAKAEVRALLDDAEAMEAAFGEDMNWPPEMMAEMKTFESVITRQSLSAPQSLKLIILMAFQTRASRRRLGHKVRTILSERAEQEHWDHRRYGQRLGLVRTHLDQFFATVRKAAGLKLYTRLLGLWHLMHFPLYMLLIIAAIVHVVAVHLY
jgi:hypothetical protein